MVSTAIKCIVGVAVFGSVYSHPLDDPIWCDFKNQHGKSYSSLEEELYRLAIFLKNLFQIREHNILYEKGLATFTLGMNHLGDLTHEEVMRYRGLKIRELPEIEEIQDSRLDLSSELPASVDWRGKGAVTPVKDQGQCGSCWAFSTTGALEGPLSLKKNKLESLSEQYLIDCSNEENRGCEGGFPSNAMEHVGKYGIPTEKDYPYTAKDGKCKANKTECSLLVGIKAAKVPNSEAKLQAAVANIGPVSVCIDASKSSFHFYQSGVYFSDSCGSGKGELDHAVLAVGYGTENGTDYWLVKNSWGTGWGEQGYIRMSRNKNNNCGVASLATYPLLS